MPLPLPPPLRAKGDPVRTPPPLDGPDARGDEGRRASGEEPRAPGRAIAFAELVEDGTAEMGAPRTDVDGPVEPPVPLPPAPYE